MRKIEKPTYDASAVFSMCVGSIEDDDLRKRLTDIALDVANAALVYDAKASSASLYTTSSHVGNNASVVLGGVTKGELKSVYSQHMAKQKKPAYSIYEKLRAGAKDKLCPICGFGEVFTLDHYLPKSAYPLLSVVPSNLVPCCRDCNTGKLASKAVTAGAQPIHPYYDSDHFFSDQWLFAEVIPTSPPTVRFFANPPASWDIVSKDRAAAHLTGYGLSSRFSVQITNQLSALRYELSLLPDADARREQLSQRAECNRKVHKNSWQTALHQALSNSQWYCQTGFCVG